MTTFDRHIIRRLVTGYLLMVGGLILFFVLLHYLEFVDDFMDRDAPLRDIFLIYYPNYIPEIVKLTSPLALFLACVYLTGRLAQELQLTALQTSGVSLYRLLRPYLLVAVLITGTMVWFNGWVVPITNRTVLEFDQRYLKDAPRQMDVQDIHRQNRPGSYVTVGYYDRQTNTAHRVSLQRFDSNQHLLERVDAMTMDWIEDEQRWRLKDATIRTFTEDRVDQRREIAQLDTALLIFPRDLARTERDIESMTVPMAAEYVETLRRTGAGGIGQPLVGYYTKFTYPLANLILVLIALPLSSVRRRGGQAVRIGIGLAIAFGYLAIQKLTEPLGYYDTLDPLVTAWLPHAVFFVFALVLLVRARK